MGIPGRRPDVTTSALQASHRHLPDPASAQGNLARLDAPEDLSDTARDVWETVVPDLVGMKVLRPQDVIILTEFCEQVALARSARSRMVVFQTELEKAMEEGPQPGEEPKDYLARVDAYSQAVKRDRAGYVALMRLAYSAAGDLGIGPTARVRLGLGKLQGQSLLAALDARDKGEQ
jgi:P27 family predicted phage terminase small subunit